MKLLVVLGLLMIMFTPVSSTAQDNLEIDELSKKLVLAKKYFEIFPMEVEIQNAIDAVVLNVPKNDRVLFKKILERNIKIPRVVAVSEMAMAETFNEAELQAMIAFYSTDEGKAIRKKMPLYREKTEPILDQMVSDAVKSYENRTPNRL